jgi:hypothetical protein
MGVAVSQAKPVARATVAIGRSIAEARFMM